MTSPVWVVSGLAPMLVTEQFSEPTVTFHVVGSLLKATSPEPWMEIGPQPPVYVWFSYFPFT